jgi:replicative DNA helicase
VFNKDKVDLSLTHSLYAYTPLTYYQAERCKANELHPDMLVYEKGERAPLTPFRTMGVDWDKYGASSSILILDYDVIVKKFKVIKRIEVPRGEYSYDNAINLIVELNDQYNPSWIYCDAGSGEYQIERLHIIGDERPSTGLKNKVKRWQFKNTLEVIDPVTFMKTKEPLKSFMITQLQIAFEREKMILSPFDEVLHKQLIDYEVVRQAANGDYVFSKENEHFVDALGLAYLAFVLEFPDLTRTIQMPETSSKIEFSSVQLGGAGLAKMFNSIQSSINNDVSKLLNYDPDELPGDRPTMVKVSQSYRSGASGGAWGSRAAGARRSGAAGTRRLW